MSRHRVAASLFLGHARRLLIAATLFAPIGFALACGPITAGDLSADYRERVREILDQTTDEDEGNAASTLRLPRRRLRRLPVTGHTIGPFDFLDLIGCRLAPVVAARNNSLGRVLVPTRRLAHEIQVVTTAAACLPTLDPDRAVRLAKQVEQKRSELGAHLWNAVWLNEDLERFLSSGPSTLFAATFRDDAGPQLARAEGAIADRSVEQVDVSQLELSLGELRDDPAIGPVLRSLDETSRALDHVAGLLQKLDVDDCGLRERRLVRAFDEIYLPLQRALVPLDRRAGAVLPPLSALYAASAATAAVPPAMQAYAEGVLDVEGRGGLWRRYRASMRRHATSWQVMLDTCGRLPVLDTKHPRG